MKVFIKIIILYMFLTGMSFANEAEMLFRSNLQIPMIFTYVPRGLIISISDEYFFEKGSERMNLRGIYYLDKIAVLINKIEKDIVVESHYSYECSKNEQYDNLWEISLAKANNITRYLIRCGGVNPEKIFAIGYGEISPLNSNPKFTDRVDFVILDYKATR